MVEDKVDNSNDDDISQDIDLNADDEEHVDIGQNLSKQEKVEQKPVDKQNVSEDQNGSKTDSNSDAKTDARKLTDDNLAFTVDQLSDEVKIQGILLGNAKTFQPKRKRRVEAKSNLDVFDISDDEASPNNSMRMKNGQVSVLDFASEHIKEKLNSSVEEIDTAPIKHNFVKRAREKPAGDSQESNGKSSQEKGVKPKKTNPYEIDYDESCNQAFKKKHKNDDSFNDKFGISTLNKKSDADTIIDIDGFASNPKKGSASKQNGKIKIDEEN